MDRERVKLLLESYRPQDASDPIFAEALETVQADPELASWFEEMQRFDAVMASKFQEIDVPTDVRNHILLGPLHSAPAASRRGRPWVLMTGSIAALLFLGMFSWYQISQRRLAASPLEMQAISYSDQMPALQFVCFKPAAVAAWVNDQPGSQKVGLKLPKLDQVPSMGIIGSSVMDWNGRPVVMVCLQNGRQMALLYILKDEDPAGRERETDGTFRHANWTVQTTHAEGQVRLLAIKGSQSAQAEFPSPF